MKLPKRNVYGNAGDVNITPLCDIMLSLLIFFMLVSRAGIDTGADMAMTLPVVSMATEEDLQEADLGGRVVLNIYGQAGTEITEVTTQTTLGDEVTLQIGGGQDTLTPFLVQQRGSNDNFKVILRAERSEPYRYIEPVLLAAAQAQVASINTAVVNEGE